MIQLYGSVVIETGSLPSAGNRIAMMYADNQGKEEVLSRGGSLGFNILRS